MGPSKPECVCVTPICVEQGKYTAAGEEAEVRVFACAPGLDRPSPEPRNPRCACREEYASRLVRMAMGAYRRARLEGTSDAVTGKVPACVCVCVCVREREREAEKEREKERETSRGGGGE